MGQSSFAAWQKRHDCAEFFENRSYDGGPIDTDIGITRMPNLTLVFWVTLACQQSSFPEFAMFFNFVANSTVLSSQD
jgi:hypothetical protein